jgi:hypothetical protein
MGVILTLDVGEEPQFWLLALAANPGTTNEVIQSMSGQKVNLLLYYRFVNE